MKVKIEKGLVGYLLVQIILLAIFYLPWLSGSSSYFFRDMTHYVEPFMRFCADSMHKFRLPLWNPFCYCGMPQMSISVQGICYPGTWLFALLPFNAAFAANMLIHQTICGLGGFLLVRSLNWGLLPAIICGASLAMCGYEFSLSANFSLVQSSAWCPLSFWAIYELGKTQRSIQEQNKNSPAFKIMIAAFSMAMQILAGHPELSSFEFTLLGSFIGLQAWQGYRSGDNDWKEIFSNRARAVIIAIFLAMPAILPALEWLSISRRSAGLSLEEALILSGNWYDMACLALGQPLGDLQLRYAEFRPLVMKGQLVPYMSSAFLGPGILTLALWSLGDRKWKERLWLALLLLAALMLCLGENTPLAPLVLQVAKSAIRFPIKLMFFAVWCLAIMAARGLYLCMNETNRTPWLSLAVWTLLASLAGLLLLNVHVFDLAIGFGTFASDMQLIWRHAEKVLAISALTASAAGLLITVLAFFYSKNQARLKYFPQLLIAFSISSLLFHAYSYCHNLGPADFYSTPSELATELAKLRSEDPPGSANRSIGLYLEHFTVPPKFERKDNLASTISSYQYSRQVLRPNTNIDLAEPSSFGFEGTCTGDYYFFLNNCYGKSHLALGLEPAKANDFALARFCQATATQYAFSQIYRFSSNPNQMIAVEKLDSRFFQLVFENQASNIRVYRVINSLPRAYFTDCFAQLPSGNEAIQQAFEPEKSGYNPAERTIIEVPAGSADAAMPSQDHRTSDNLATIKQDNVNDIEIAVDAKQAGYLVLADQYYPGWKAELDGKQCAILRANCFTRAVALPAGKHIVKFSYLPGSFFGGILLSCLAFIWLLVLSFK